MELQFNKTVCPCLRRVISQVRTQEETQELRLPDTMPDIGRILGCWGQILVRGKEWRSGGMTVSGGVMAWVLYAPEDGSAPQSVDTWIPFQMKWDFPDTQRDGIILIHPYLKGMDCRSISARKLMIRASISAMGDAMEQVDVDVYEPVSVPEDVQLLKRTYPMELPQEAGEKPFQIEEEITLPGNTPPLRKVVRYEVCPEIKEQKVMAGRLVFRGMCCIHVLYVSEDGSLNTLDSEVGFSQFTDLDRDYGTSATAVTTAVTTGLELELNEEGKLQLKCGLSAQYVIYDRAMIEILEDAYSPQRAVNALSQELKLPVRLDVQLEELPYHQTARLEAGNVLDVAAFWGPPTISRTGSDAEAELSVQWQILYYDENGSLQGCVSGGEEKWSLPSDHENQIQVLADVKPPQITLGSDGVDITGRIHLEASAFSERGIPMITTLDLGDEQTPDPCRPSLILRRMGDNSLWDLAKECGSTVEAITKANQLQQEPQSNQMLLIPVY